MILCPTTLARMTTSIAALSAPAREVPRYLVAGAVNTAASWLVYVALLQLVRLVLIRNSRD